MPRNKFLDNNVSRLYQHNALCVMIFTWIKAQKFTVPSISVEESALAFMKHEKIDEEEMSLRAVTSIYERINKELIEQSKTR